MSNYDAVLKECEMAAGPFPSSARLCDWCATPLPPRRRRWCSDKCGKDAADNHWYRQGRVRALRRDRFTCQGCGKRGAGMQTNHIVPCLGKHSIVGCEHHIDNLETLCVECHKDETKRQRKAGEI